MGTMNENDLEMQWHCAAIIVAAGAGRRFRSEPPKQFIPLNGRPIFHYGLQRFVETGWFDQIVLVLPSTYQKGVEDEIRPSIPSDVRFRVVAGGERRQDSVRRGLEQVESPCDLVLVHDGVRPFPSRGLIDSVVRRAQDCKAVVPVIPIQDTIKEVAEGNRVVRTIERGRLGAAQTPQGFHFNVLKRAYEMAEKGAYQETDDAALVERLGIPVTTIPGEVTNLKITTPEDMEVAKFLQRERGL